MALLTEHSKRKDQLVSSRATLEGLWSALNDVSPGLGQDKVESHVTFMHALTKLYSAASESSNEKGDQIAREAVHSFQDVLGFLIGQKSDPSEVEALSKHLYGIYETLREFAQGKFTEERWHQSQARLMNELGVRILLVAGSATAPGSTSPKELLIPLPLPVSLNEFLAQSQLQEKQTQSKRSVTGALKAVATLLTGQG